MFVTQARPSHIEMMSQLEVANGFHRYFVDKQWEVEARIILGRIALIGAWIQSPTAWRMSFVPIPSFGESDESTVKYRAEAKRVMRLAEKEGTHDLPWSLNNNLIIHEMRLLCPEWTGEERLEKLNRDLPWHPFNTVIGGAHAGSREAIGMRIAYVIQSLPRLIHAADRLSTSLAQSVYGVDEVTEDESLAKQHAIIAQQELQAELDLSLTHRDDPLYQASLETRRLQAINRLREEVEPTMNKDESHD